MATARMACIFLPELEQSGKGARPNSKKRPERRGEWRRQSRARALSGKGRESFVKGKQTCRILKEIRAEIARRNDIALTVRECTFQGECRGTCPRCEQEVRYLEEQLARRRKLQKTVALAGVSAGIIVALSGCRAMDAPVDSALPTPSAEPTEGVVYLAGEIQPDDDLTGVAEVTPEPEDDILLGIAMPEEGLDATPSAAPRESDGAQP